MNLVDASRPDAAVDHIRDVGPHTVVWLPVIDNWGALRHDLKLHAWSRTRAQGQAGLGRPTGGPTVRLSLPRFRTT